MQHVSRPGRFILTTYKHWPAAGRTMTRIYARYVSIATGVRLLAGSIDGWDRINSRSRRLNGLSVRRGNPGND